MAIQFTITRTKADPATLWYFQSEESVTDQEYINTNSLARSFISSGKMNPNESISFDGLSHTLVVILLDPDPIFQEYGYTIGDTVEVISAGEQLYNEENGITVTHSYEVI